jgi:hypothetical protein
MNCKEAYVCLLTSERPAAPPLELGRHLLRCPQCRSRQARLLRLEGEVHELNGELRGPTPVARQELLAQLGPQSVQPIPIGAQDERPGRRDPYAWVGWVAVAGVAAVVMLSLGLGLGWSLSLLVGRPGTPLAGRPAAAPQESLVARILESDLKLAEVSTSKDQLAALADIAGELRREALRLSQEGSVEDVILLSGLYERVVCQGLVGRARLLPAEQQDGLLASLVGELEQTADASERAALSAQPGANEGLRHLARAARTASRTLMGAGEGSELRAPAWQPARSGTMRDLVGTLVLHALLLAEEQDPLRRADHCNEVAEHLVQGILLASAGGDTDRAAKLGGFLGNMMDRGVISNLERYQPAGPEDARMAEAARIGERSARAVEVLEKNLEKAPAAAQVGLQKALEATQRGQDNGPSSKGKKSRPEKTPPGLLKKLTKGDK